MAAQSRGTNIGTRNFYAYARGDCTRAADEESECLTWWGEEDDPKRERRRSDEDGRVHGTMPGLTEKEGGWKETADTKRSGRENARQKRYTTEWKERSGAQTENER